jgi:DNA-directed RNA polymerase II subunit RPB1
MGIVQDSLLGIMLFTQRDNFMSKDVVMNLIMHLSGEQAEFAMRQLPMPAIVKPKPLWTGKQLMSLIIPNINLVRKGHKNAGSKLNYAPADDKMVIIKKGELIAGEFTKAIVGSASGGIIHIIWKECGPNACRDFLTSAQNVVNSWLAEHGFTVGVEDTVTNLNVKEKIADTLLEHKKKVESIINQSRDGTLKQ